MWDSMRKVQFLVSSQRIISILNDFINLFRGL